MLRIRLQRVGRKKSPSYRVIVSERSKDPYAGGIEILGHYNPVAQPKVLELKADRILEWISKGAQPSETVANLLIREGIITEPKKKSVKISKKRQAKLDAKNTEKIEKEKAAKEKAEAEKVAAKEAAAAEKLAAAEAKKAEAEAKAAEEAAPAEETPKEEATEEAPKEDTPAEEPAAEAETPSEEVTPEEAPTEEAEEKPAA
jgi:small subunit ribosomal protein S16